MLELTVRLLVSLSLVIGLLLLLARFGGRRFRGGRDPMVRVLHRHHLSRGSTVSVVAVGSRLLVLGATEHQVRVLTELDPDDLATTDAEVLSLAEGPAERPVASDPAAAAGALAGSVLSAATWRQALAAATRRSS
ncbi:flagellar biosynthetic protein FliO [Nocardioides sp.]|uniref:flagellar biosynthetic protein FliO n=1 Tax=Nocardioides sp. TaxID=35761 RepID=UPI00261BCBF6|nr:flagellar biosynthetic protein FliO [Nocardioides sp.]MDI6909294.1 flagellar biosynthetic protein FliO [Nocardioides sp.]